MYKALLLSSALLISSEASADCSFTLSGGEMQLSGLSTAQVDADLTTKFTSVERRITSKSKVTEIGIECELGYGIAVAASEMSGFSASIDRDVYFTGYQSPQMTIPRTLLFHVNEEVSARAVRLSLVKYFDLGTLSPFVRIGVEHVDAVHRAYLPLGKYSLSYQEDASVTAPYVGVGIAIARKGPISLRLEYQLEAPHPHQLTTMTLGINGRFEF